MKVLDCHIHYNGSIPPKDMISLLDESKTDLFSLVLVPDRQLITSVCDAMVLKAIAKNRCYVFSSLDVSKYFMKPKKLGEAFAEYTASLMKMGVDGIKLIEGKPNMRKPLPIPNFDLPIWDPFWKYCEENKVPILMHLNDPEEFWDETKAPSWAKEKGWLYDSSYPNNEDQYNQMLNVLKKHPNLKIIFAHFFFMSCQLERLQNILDTYKNVMIDLTPGIEMYINFQKDIKRSKEFFIKNQDRIIYGTDIGARAVLENKPLNKLECLQRSEIVRGFLELDKLHVHADDNYLIGFNDFDLIGLKLNNEILEKIYSNNFINFVGPIKPIKPKLVIKEARRLRMIITIMGMVDKNIKRDFTYLNTAIRFFKKNKEVQ